MAFAESVGGERYNLRTGNVVPKKLSAAFLAAVPAPSKWMLVKLSQTANDEVEHCVSGDVPYGFIFSLTGGINMASILEFRDNTLLVEWVGAAPTVGLTTAVANGDVGTVLIGGFLRDRMKSGASSSTVINFGVYAPTVALIRNG
jgi:hypothetical protein